MTYRQLLTALAQAEIWEDTLIILKVNFPHKGSAEEKDNHQSKIDTIEAALNLEIEE